MSVEKILRNPSARVWILVALATALLSISVALLLYASTHSLIPRWGGPVDVAAALGLFLFALWAYRTTAGTIDVRALRVSYYVALLLPSLLLAAMWWFADRLIWNILLPGLAWRLYLVMEVLPRVLTMFRTNSRGSSSDVCEKLTTADMPRHRR
jgi:hypothetical protein